jgi:hypothetical protein
VCTSPLPPGVLADEKEPLETATSQWVNFTHVGKS